LCPPPQEKERLAGGKKSQTVHRRTPRKTEGSRSKCMKKNKNPLEKKIAHQKEGDREILQKGKESKGGIPLFSEREGGKPRRGACQHSRWKLQTNVSFPEDKKKVARMTYSKWPGKKGSRGKKKPIHLPKGGRGSLRGAAGSDIGRFCTIRRDLRGGKGGALPSSAGEKCHPRRRNWRHRK